MQSVKRLGSKVKLQISTNTDFNQAFLAEIKLSTDSPALRLSLAKSRSFAEMWVDLETVLQSEESQRKPNNIRCSASSVFKEKKILKTA